MSVTLSPLWETIELNISNGAFAEICKEARIHWCGNHDTMEFLPCDLLAMANAVETLWNKDNKRFFLAWRTVLLKLAENGGAKLS
jgi:hypothetical protein